MSQDFTKFIVLFITIFPVLNVEGGAGECRRFIGESSAQGSSLHARFASPSANVLLAFQTTRTIECYDCDSRFDPHCKVIDENNIHSIKPYSKPCAGCCVKFVHKLANGEDYIHRMCTQHIIINYFMVDHVCMSEGKGRGKMCFCEEHLCNSAPSRLLNNHSAVLFLILPAMVHGFLK